MRINLSFKEFKNNHSKKKHQILFRSRSCNQYYKVENLFRFLKVIIHQTRWDVILFSPGGESFDQFKDYSHRGRIFNKYIKKFKI